MVIPSGIIDFLPEDAKIHKNQFDILNTFFSSYQFEPIKTPTIEYFESLSLGLGDTLKKASVKFFDPGGELLMLRPDHTAPIARLVASQMTTASLPLKLYYMDPVFRKTKESHNNIETIQAGCEIIGDNSPESDSEIIELCYKSLEALGYKDIGIDVGHVSFVDNLSPEKKEALLTNDYLTYGEIPKRGNGDLAKNIPHLNHVYSLLAKKNLDKHVLINQGLVKDIRYYTGIIFEAYIKSSRHVVASGGRYDQLLNKFGFNQPAVGFALNLSALREINK
tara:strand:- start:3624 stop:4460 length:837 start_codon:yes stop_codon:yes gene_type:complete